MKTITPYGYESPFDSIMFKKAHSQTTTGTDKYYFGPAYNTNDFVEECRWAINRMFRLQDVICDSEDGWFAMYVLDCHDPPIYAINAKTFADAFETFVDLKVAELKIDEDDMVNYGKGNRECNFSSNGTPVDTEAVSGFQLRVVEARYSHNTL